MHVQPREYAKSTIERAIAVMENNTITIPEQIARTNSRLSKWFASSILNFFAWRIVGELPNEKKFILAVAPHTSNWDFIVGVLVKLSLQLKLNFLGKDAIFFWPFSVWLKSIGGIPIDRSCSNGVVGQMVNEFNQAEQLILALAPEGTRSKVNKWKSGFLHIAHQAHIPVVPVQIDYLNKQVIFFKSRQISHNIEQELNDFKLLFNKECAKNPHCF